MIQSMTGYGVGTVESTLFNVTAELKSLNSKYFELSLKMPAMFSQHEHKVRNRLAESLTRGKVSLVLHIEVRDNSRRSLNINRDLARAYLNELQDLADYLEISPQIELPYLLNLPEVIPTEPKEADPEEWRLVEEAISNATEAILESRKVEGRALEEDLAARSKGIARHLKTVESLAPKRREAVRERLEQGLSDLKKSTGEVDSNRFEQELIFYIEKLDINEEIVRLRQHLEYFDELLANGDNNGKQLQFLSQEMGREINTIGSKANDATIQRTVVAMKDELERIKEQVLNVV